MVIGSLLEHVKKKATNKGVMDKDKAKLQRDAKRKDYKNYELGESSGKNGAKEAYKKKVANYKKRRHELKMNKQVPFKITEIT